MTSTPSNGDDESASAAQILPHHLDDLRRSGLTDETIQAAEIYSEADGDRIAALLNWSGPAGRLAPVLVIPFLAPDGNRTGYCRVKPDRPRIANGARVRYESPRQRSNEPYFPPATGEVLGDSASPLIVTEG